MHPLKKTNTKIKDTGYQYTCSRWKLEKFGEGGRVISLPFTQSALAGNVLTRHLSKRSDTITSNWRKRTKSHVYQNCFLISALKQASQWWQQLSVAQDAKSVGSQNRSGQILSWWKLPLLYWTQGGHSGKSKTNLSCLYFLWCKKCLW